jgi:hypothetical protein
MEFDTAGQLINDAAVELGLLSADLADPYASTDPNIVQLCRLLKGLGQDLLRSHEWAIGTRVYQIATSPSTAEYALFVEAQVGGFIDQTAWNLTARSPLVGPLSPQQWEQLQAQPSTQAVGTSFRIVRGVLELYPVPTAVESLQFEFKSLWWVDSATHYAASGGAWTDALHAEPTAGDDVCGFDRRLLVCGIKRAWLRAKGLDSTAAEDDYQAALSVALGNDGAAPRLSLNGGGRLLRFLDGRNIPETGFGA